MLGSRAAFLAIVAALLVAGCDAQRRFPFCNCVRPRGPGGPYTMIPTTEVVQDDGTYKICWALTARDNLPDAPCSAFDLRKIELNINIGCRSAVKYITFGNRKMPASIANYPGDGALVLKITGDESNLGTLAELAGKSTPVCLIVRDGPCDTRRTYCRGGFCDFAFFSPDKKCCPGNPNVNRQLPPPPPPPKDVNPFPFCACDITTPFNSFSLSPADRAPASIVTAAGTTYCWTLSAEEYQGNETICVNYDLKKIEWDINTNCQNAVEKITYGGSVVSASYARFPADNALVLKITRGTSPLATLDDLLNSSKRVCITLNSICPTLASFCRAPFCKVAFFSPNNKCCPLANLVSAA